MSDIDQQIQEGVQKALQEKEDKEKLARRFGMAVLVACLFGYVIWSKFWIFSLYENMLFWAMGIGAVVGFFLQEIFFLALCGLAGLMVYSCYQKEQGANKTPTLVAPAVSGPGSTYTDPTTGMEFVYVKGGCYQMGDTFGEGSSVAKVHEVCVDSFWMGKYEVMQGEWGRLMSPNPSRFQRGSRYPVENVSWYDAQDFIISLSRRSDRQYRLPTEAEWEYAARSGGQEEKWAGTSDESRVGEYAWCEGNSGGTTHEAGTRYPNGLGLYDMSGNVWEWCSDWYFVAYSKFRDNPGGPSNGMTRVTRGGSLDRHPALLEASNRDNAQPGGRYDNLGFRLVLPTGQRVR